MFVENINLVLTYLVLFAQIFLVANVVLLIFPKSRNIIFSYLKIHGLKLAFLVALTATLGSLFYSKVAGYDPCELCWYQRIFMYPQIFLLGYAIYRKEKTIIDYSILLLIAGTLISIYHNFIYYNKVFTSFCSIDNVVACTTKYDLGLGYLSIPLMSLSAFVLIGYLLLVSKKQ